MRAGSAAHTLAGSARTRPPPLAPPPPTPRAAEMDVLLARRDRVNCPIKPFVRIMGRNAACPNTGLPYAHCCGARADAPASHGGGAPAAAPSVA